MVKTPTLIPSPVSPAPVGKVCTIRVSKGDDSMAACGQLGDPGSVRKQAPLLPPPANLQAALAAAGVLPGATAAAEASEEPKGCGCGGQ